MDTKLLYSVGEDTLVMAIDMYSLKTATNITSIQQQHTLKSVIQWLRNHTNQNVVSRHRKY